ncbi:hypothetical protein HRbin39_00332 [bacterium HR39]|nr:hypothetical protein HRbin39_00332 [bacterium HR39]
MNRLDLDLALERVSANRWYPWVVAGLTALAVLALAVLALADGTLRDAARRPLTVTVALPPGAAADVAALAEALEARPDVLAAEPVPMEELGALAREWGAGSGGAVLLPRLLDVTFRPGVRPDPRELREAVARLSPEATVVAGEGAAADGDLLSLARIARAAALAVLALAVLALLAFTAHTVRVDVRAQAETVDLLRLMGADDAYVARQFEQAVAGRGLRGAVGGFVAAVLALLVAMRGAAVFWPQAAQAALRPLDWLALAALPVLMVLAAVLTTRLVVRRGLARLP